MVKERIDDLVDIIGEEYAMLENTFVIRNNEQLVRYLQNPDEWMTRQMADRNRYKRRLIMDARKQIDSLNDKVEKVFLLAYKEVDKDIIEIQTNQIVAKDLPGDAKKQIQELKQFNAKEVVRLANASYTAYTTQVRIINDIKQVDDFYEVVKNQMRKGIENGIKITYSDGKTYSWKSYMEMNIRTTLHQEMTDRQIKIGTKVGQIFYICDSFADCAPDHADYQGKIYYNEDVDIPNDVMDFINQNGIMSMQEVVNNEPFLTSRPNCRHNLHAISMEDVMGGKSAEELTEEKGYKFGEYDQKNYEALQQQRYNERQIRKYKMRVENNKRIQSETGVRNILAIKRANNKVKEWQSKQRELIANNKGVLERNYQRESAKTIVQNLGVKYDYKVVDGELIKR